MDLAEKGINRKVFIKGWGAEIFSNNFLFVFLIFL